MVGCLELVGRGKWTKADLKAALDAKDRAALGFNAPPDLRRRIFSAPLHGHVAEQRYVRAMAEAPARDALSRAQYADLKIWLPGDILTKVDRTSMAVSLEAREPLLDHRLVEFAASLPANMRLRGGTGKWLMKRALASRLPQEKILVNWRQ